MKQSAVLLCIIFGLFGCKNQTPSVNLLAPYGSTRVAPPPTNGHRGAAPYYNGTSTDTSTGTAPAGTGVTSTPTIYDSAQATSAATVPLAANAQPVGTGVQSTATDTGSVQPASFEAPVELDMNDAVDAAPGSTLRLKGMPVNDATNLPDYTEPARFQPPPHASSLLAPARQQAASNPVAASGVVSTTSKSSDTASKKSAIVAEGVSAAGTGLKWKSRY